MKRNIQKRQVFINAVTSVTQVVITGVILFVLYRFLLDTIGVEQLGIWSVVLAITSMTGIVNLGFSGSVIKFVAKYLAKGEEKNVADVIQTSVISIGVFSGITLLILYFLANQILRLIIPSVSLEDALIIFPYALLSLWIILIADVFRAGLDGCQRIDVRNITIVIATLFNLIFCFVLVPNHGLIGLAYSRIIQVTVLLVADWFMLKRILSFLPIVPYKWNYKLFKEMINYGLNIQVISISQMLCGPITKVLLTKFGGLTMVGFYEMASRMISKLRDLIVSANQVLVPLIANLQERTPNTIQNIYRKNYRLIFYIAVPFYSAIIAFVPLISIVWIGYYEAMFVIFSILLVVIFFVNTLSVPAYFSYLGIGKLEWITLGMIIRLFVNIVLSLIAGYFFGGIGVVAAWVIVSILGNLIIVVSYHRVYKISLKNLLPKENVWVIISCFVAIFSSFLIYYRFYYILNNVIIATITIIITFLMIIFSSIWFHPIRKQLIKWTTSKLLGGG